MSDQPSFNKIQRKQNRVQPPRFCDDFGVWRVRRQAAAQARQLMAFCFERFDDRSRHAMIGEKVHQAATSYSARSRA